MLLRKPLILAALCASTLGACFDSGIVEHHAVEPPSRAPMARTRRQEHSRRSSAASVGPARGGQMPSSKQDRPVSFVVLGDGGTGDRVQRAVASGVRKVCARRGCQFALYLGDNIYEGGVSGPDDRQFQDKFEVPYRDLDFPFFVILGNHDYGPYAVERAEFQVAYTRRSKKWVMPHRYYTFRAGPVAFFGIDTNAILHDPQEQRAQREWLLRELARSDARWKIAFGHHPYISNGAHGNAGNYNGHGDESADGLMSGEPLAELARQALCGRAQLYLAGHDHHREWLEPTCGTHFLISGAAAKLRSMARRDAQPSRWSDNREHGFLWIGVEGNTLRGAFYDADGNMDYEDRIVL